MAYGSAAAGKLLLLTDDNRLPSSTTRVKVRLVNGIDGSDPLTLSVDYLALASNVVAGSTSTYATANSNSSVQLQVTSATASEPLYQTTSTTPFNLLGQGVYTVFMLSGNATPTGIPRRER
jgi:hypothetical protein